MQRQDGKRYDGGGGGGEMKGLEGRGKAFGVFLSGNTCCIVFPCEIPQNCKLKFVFLCVNGISAQGSPL